MSSTGPRGIEEEEVLIETENRRVEELYYEYIRSENVEVHSMLNRLASMPEVSKQTVDE
jgi:hypothetical protein